MKPGVSSLFGQAVLVCVALSSTPAFAQLGEPANDLGVKLGHIHLTVKNVEAQTQFWTEMMGGSLVKNGPLSMIQFSGVFILLPKAMSTSIASMCPSRQVTGSAILQKTARSITSASR
jgi:hypothetical protein